jgi:hypothetical protein
MKLFRIATVYLDRKLVIDEKLCIDDGATSVYIQDASFGGELGRLLLQAVTVLEARPEVSSLGEVTVPEQARKRAEVAIETVANFLSVLNHSRRRIASPRPFVALGIDDEDEKGWASSLSRFQGEHTSIPKTSYCLPTTSENLQAFSDRLDGVALLAEALAHEHSTGKFHEFMRLFERAFALAPSQFEKKLAQFLRGADLGYDRAEVKRWIELRNPATHANDLTRSDIVFESHVRPVIARMEQAAFDVLLNKNTWAHSSKERRPLWRPPVATISPKNALRLTQGLEAKFQFQILDPFDAFVYDGGFRIPELPNHLWSSWAKTEAHISERPETGTTRDGDGTETGTELV